jgi:hypothetical protein
VPLFSNAFLKKSKKNGMKIRATNGDVLNGDSKSIRFIFISEF